ncbi:MAG: DUF3106 domain-containing protein [Telluria sp.]
MRVTGLQLRHAVIACSTALVLAAAGAWAAAQQQPAPAVAAKPPAAPAAAQPAPKKPARTPDRPLWRDLTPAQRAALEPLAGEWDAMDGVRKQKWLEMSNHFATMKPEEQARIHERMREWVRLTPAERKLARETYKRTKKLAPGEKAATWQSYQQLPDEQKQKLAAQAAARKQGATPPTGATHAASPLKKGTSNCPAGTVKNHLSATPPCVPAPAPVTAPAPAAVQPSTATPAAPAAPATNAQ